MEDCERHNNIGRLIMTLPRIRQLVFASNAHSDIEQLQHILGLGSEFVDPGVGEFGLTNGVFSIGDQFLEVVVPVADNTAAGRFIERGGGLGGYMAIFQTDDLARVRDAADALAIRRVWNIDLPDICASHLHPADIGAAIVSIDEAKPESSWRWGGPSWQENSAAGAIQVLQVTAMDPQAMSEKWARVLNITVTSVGPGVFELPLAEGVISFISGDRDYLSAYQIGHAEPAACLKRAAARGLPCDSTSFQFAGVKVSLAAIDPIA